MLLLQLLFIITFQVSDSNRHAVYIIGRCYLKFTYKYKQALTFTIFGLFYLFKQNLVCDM